jgi:hypothetical protein
MKSLKTTEQEKDLVFYLQIKYIHSLLIIKDKLH